MGPFKKLWTLSPRKDFIFNLFNPTYPVFPLISYLKHGDCYPVLHCLLDKWQYFLSNLNTELCLLAKLLSVLICSLVIRGGFEGVNSFKYVIPRSQMENSFLLVCQCLSTGTDCL